MQDIPSASVSLTRKQRRAIPLILAEKSIETGCRSAGIAKQTFYNWLKDETFRGEYQRQQSQLFRPRLRHREAQCPGRCRQARGTA
jgi:hypothetical protein